MEKKVLYDMIDNIDKKDYGFVYDLLERLLENAGIVYKSKYDYGFKIIAQLKDELSEEDRKIINSKIEYLKQLLEITQLDDTTFVKIRTDNQDLASACGFFFELEDYKEMFKKLEYYDYIDDEMEILV